MPALKPVNSAFTAAAVNSAFKYAETAAKEAHAAAGGMAWAPDAMQFEAVHHLHFDAFSAKDVGTKIIMGAVVAGAGVAPAHGLGGGKKRLHK